MTIGFWFTCWLLTSPAIDPAASSSDILGDVVVEAAVGTTSELPPFRIRYQAPTGARASGRIASILRQDLLTFGRFVLVEDDSEVADATILDGAVSLSIESYGRGRWAADALVTTPNGEVVVGPLTAETPAEIEAMGHRLADRIVEVFTGRASTFSAALAMVRTDQHLRRAYVLDHVGAQPRLATAPTQLVSTVAFGPRGRLVFAASTEHGAYGLHGPGVPPRLRPYGSIYGIAWSPDGARVAVSIADGEAIAVYAGSADFADLRRVGRADIGLQPTFLSDGRVVWAGTRRRHRRIYVEDRPVSPTAVAAYAPTACDHPDGARLVWVEDVGSKRRLVVAKPDGTRRRVLKVDATDVDSPSCSADGRLVAFVVRGSDRLLPGLYVANLDRWQPKRVGTVVGDSVRWSRPRR